MNIAELGEGNRGERGYTVPATYEELRAVLSSSTLRLPKQLKRVAVIAWQHPNEIALGTASSVAEMAGVQPSAVVRFAQVLGYSGFSDLQLVLKDFLKSGSAASSRRKSRRVRTSAPSQEGEGLVPGLIQASYDALDRLEKEFDVYALNKAAALLAQASTLHLIGSKRAFPITSYMSLTLSQLGIKNVLIDNVGSMAFDQIGCLEKGDAVIAVSFSPYNSITPDLVAVALERGATVVALTDSALSPLVGGANLVLEIIESTYAGYRSLAASAVVGLALVVEIANHRSTSRHHIINREEAQAAAERSP